VFDTLRLTPRECRAHELELLALLALFPGAVPLGVYFGALPPRWAVEAAERLLAAGELTGDADGALALTSNGRTSAARSLWPVPRDGQFPFAPVV